MKRSRMDKNILFETESHLQGGILCFDEKFSDNDFQSFGLSMPRTSHSKNANGNQEPKQAKVV